MSEVQEVPQSIEQEKSTVEFAGFWRRLVALVIDLIILSLLDGCISSFGNVFGNVIEGAPAAWGIAWYVVVILIPVVYFVWAYSRSGQTPGKSILGIRVVAIDGSPLNWRKGFLRYLGYIPSTIVFFLGFLWLIWDRDKQAWHDKIAGTCVVHGLPTLEEIKGIIEPAEALRRQRKWLTYIGIPAIILFIVAGIWAWTGFQRGMAEIDDMAPWPDVIVPAQQIVNPDLSHLGLQLADITDANSEAKWQGAHFIDGAVATYHRGGDIVAMISILKYPDSETLEADWYVLIDSIKQLSGSHSWLSNDMANKGIVSFYSTDISEKLFRNGQWLISIIVTPDLSIDQIRDSLTSYWHTKPRR